MAKATGRDWDEWLDFLDALDAREMTHREIVGLVAGKGGLSNGWWQQMVTVGYEQATGLRIVGQTADASYQIGVQKTLPDTSGISHGTCWSPAPGGTYGWARPAPSSCDKGRSTAPPRVSGEKCARWLRGRESA